MYLQVEEEQIREALKLLNDHLGVQRIFQSLLTIDLHSDLRHLVELQCAIIHVLQVVEATVRERADWGDYQSDLEGLLNL